MHTSQGIQLPKLIFGSSALGNLYQVLDEQSKHQLVHQWFRSCPGQVCIDTAGKYGAGMALETLGDALRAQGRPPDSFQLSNKLGWKQIPLEHDVPQFEPGVWEGLSHDAIQDISYDGILACWEQGNRLIGAPYTARILSVHDPDEYLADAESAFDRDRRYTDILDAYQALSELRNRGAATAIGVGAKDWRVAVEISRRADLDWVMIAGSLTLYDHPDELLSAARELSDRRVSVVNSAVFHAGFLTGGPYFNYRNVSPDDRPDLFQWRASFHEVCRHFTVKPADACIEFALAPRGVSSIALNTAKADRIPENARAVESRAPSEFWKTLRQEALIRYTPEEIQ